MKLLIGGSPCTHWSIARANGRETRPDGIGWELFRNYVIALEKFNPDYFLYENNKSMSPAIRAQITQELGVEPVLINSALVSAQNRQRLYWVGRRNPDGTYSTLPVAQPEDRGILIRDILESGVCWREKGYILKANYYKSTAVSAVDGAHFPAHMAAEPIYVGEVPGHKGKYRNGKQASQQYRVYSIEGKRVCLDSDSRKYIAEPVRIGTIEIDAKNASFDSQQYRVYSQDGKSVTLCGQGGGVGAKTGLYAVLVGRTDSKTYPVYEVRNGQITIKGKKYPIKLADGLYIIRKLTVTECKRLQTVPEDYIFPVSDTQAYKMLGNGWTVDVIAHILSYCPGITEEPLEVLSMYDGMSCGRLALDKLGAHIAHYYASEIDKYAIQTTQHNFPDIIQMGDAFQVREDGWCLPGYDPAEFRPERRLRPVNTQMDLFGGDYI